MCDIPHNHQHDWKRAHRDWRFWIALLLMLAAMVAYVITVDESFRSAGPLQLTVPALGG